MKPSPEKRAALSNQHVTRSVNFWISFLYPPTFELSTTTISPPTKWRPLLKSAHPFPPSQRAGLPRKISNLSVNSPQQLNDQLNLLDLTSSPTLVAPVTRELSLKMIAFKLPRMSRRLRMMILERSVNLKIQ